MSRPLSRDNGHFHVIFLLSNIQIQSIHPGLHGGTGAVHLRAVHTDGLQNRHVIRQRGGQVPDGAGKPAGAVGDEGNDGFS